MTLLLSVAVITLAIWAVVRKVDVRLVLFLAALALGCLAQKPMAVFRIFLDTLADEKYVVPICTAMGFAYVLRHTGCDQHLVWLLTKPLRRIRALLIPGTVLVGFLVNIPVISQTSTAVTIGAVLIPLLQTARISPVTTGAALLLGSSVGGELLNPGAPELRTVVDETAKAAQRLEQPDVSLTGSECVAHLLPLNLLNLTVSTLAFWWLSARAEARRPEPREGSVEGPEEVAEPAPDVSVNYFKALVPLIPLALLFLTGRPLELLPVPQTWLVDQPVGEHDSRFDSRLIGLAMLVGVAAASLAAPRTAKGTASAFFDGAGYAFTHIISLIVTARCFGEGVKGAGLARLIGQPITAWPDLMLPAAGTLPLGFAALCGSGMASTQSLFEFFVEPALRLGMHPADVGAVVSLAAAAGRTMSPVAAVTLMCAALTKTDPVELGKRVAGPLLLGIASVVCVGMLFLRSQ